MTQATAQTANAARSLCSEIEQDLSRLIGYMNDELVPRIRRGSSRGLRAVAEQLVQAAEQMDRGPNRRTSSRPAAEPRGK